MAYYDNPPPPYPGNASNSKASKNAPPGYDAASQPLLSSSVAGRSGIYHQPAVGDVPDDFLYGATVAECAISIRNEFVRKVYTILFCQIVATTIVAGLISRSQDAVFWVVTHTWSFYVPLFGTLVNLGLLYWKRHSEPLNYVLLSTFTLLEAFTLGIMTAFIDNEVVLQALLITVGVFLGLTLFTLQSKYDFSSMGSWLFAGLFALMTTGLVGIFIPFSRTFDLVLAMGGVLLFSGYIIYDTYIITKRLSHDEYIAAAISLYLDFINLFINILRILNDVQRD
ncbi:inhibitor of apoptosis-promoting Bax1-domain-containing protein [Fomes fomentarius]|nr:inhibitor of apoptosis-promoting Bax1-domain-containing protein [Fomes fomentarius]